MSCGKSMQSEALATPTSERQSVALRALAIPEILSATLLPLQGDPDQHLLACTLVNKSWNYQANKLLWEHCGICDSTATAPSISALVSLPLERRQLYANMIRHLTINQPFEAIAAPEYFDQLQEDLRTGKRRRVEDEEAYSSDVYWTGVHIPQLNEVSFPRLEILDIEGPSTEDEKSTFQAEFLLPFAQSTLKKLYIHPGEVHCQMISDGFLESLEQNCNSLTECLCPLEVVSVSLERLRSFLLSFSSIEKIFESWGEIMSSGTFQAIGRLPRLKEMILDHIEDDWIDALNGSNTTSALPFVSLTGVYCSMSSYGLMGMYPYFKNLEELILVESETTVPGLWKAVACCKFTSLKTLKLYLHQDTVIDSTEFLEVLDHIAALQTMRISSGNIFDERPPLLKMEFLDDKVMEAISKRIPMIQELQLHCTGSTTGSLGEYSLLWLGTNCPKLEDLYMIATIDWARFVMIAPKGLLSMLSSIHIEGDRWDGHIDDDHRTLAEALLLRMPSLNPWKSLSISRDQAIETAFLEVLWASKEQQEFEKLAEKS